MAEPVAQPDASPPRTERAVGVFGVALGLLAILALAASLLPREKEIDAGERMAALFREGTPPPGFELVETARRPSGEVVLRLVRSGDPPTGEPEELHLLEYPGPRALVRLFGGDSNGDSGGGGDGASRQASRDKLRWEEDPTFEFHATIARGDLAWSSWQANYLVERLFQEDGAWRDSVCVNLGQPDRYLVLVGLWPTGTEASPERLEPLLGHLRLEETQ